MLQTDCDARTHRRQFQVNAAAAARARTPRERPDTKPLGATSSAIRAIIAEVAAQHMLSVETIVGYGKRGPIAAARHAAIRAVKDARPHYSGPRIAAIFGGRCPTTILYSLRKDRWPAADVQGPIVMAGPEAAIQRAIVRLLDVALPHGWLTVHVANKPRSAQSGAIEKALGAKAGFPDILVFGPPQFASAPHVYAIEVKAAKGRVRPEQQAMHDRLRDIGIPVAVCRSTDDVLSFGRDWQWPWRIAA